MFSPDATLHSVHGPSLRNPRRRQRHDSDSAKHQPPKKRSKLPDPSLDPSSASPLNGNGASGLNGHVINGDERRRSSLRHEIPVREKKQSTITARSSKGDGSALLTKTSNYAIKQLPSLPEPLRSNPSANYRTFVLPSTTYAVAFTHEHAYVWDYTSPIATPSSYTLPLPYPSKRSDPFPIGSVVKTGPASDLGLVVIHPTTGKIKFWENVDSAESLSLFQQRRQGIEGIVGNMLSGESVADIVDAGHAGFILLFNTGRVAQLAVRDAQGRPQINVQFLRSQATSGNSGFFGGLRSLVSGPGWNRDVAAVKVRPSQVKGQLEVIIGTGSGSFQLWDLSWAGHHALRGEVNAQEAILEALSSGFSPEMRSQGTAIKILDFAILQAPRSEGNELSPPGTAEGLGLLALVALTGSAGINYALVEVDLVGDTPNVQRILPLDTFAGDHSRQMPEQAKLLLPSPGHTAMVVFNHAIVFASLADRKESPDTQLMVDTGAPFKPFQDVVYFRKERNLQFVGFALEGVTRKSKSSSCIIFTKGTGTLRVTANEPRTDGQDLERIRPTAKSKLLQAVFFGNTPDSLFDVSAKPELTFEQEEVEKAAFEISQDVVNSDSEYIPVFTASQAQQLGIRAKALADLASHLKRNYPPLNRTTKWHLLWNAEKIAAGQGIWEYYEARTKLKDVNQRPLLVELIEMLNERLKTGLRPELGELDEVRQWFVKDISKITMMIPWAQLSIKEVYKEGQRDADSLLLLVNEADQLFLCALERAFIFRRDHLFEYGLESEELDYNILTSGYETLPLPWTSSPNIVNSVRQLVDIAREMVFQLAEQHRHIEEHAIAKQVAADNPRLVKLCCQVHMERYRWCLAQPDEKTRATGVSLRQEFDENVRPKQVTALAKIGMAESGMVIAERLKDMPTLVELVWDELRFLEDEVAAEDTDEAIQVRGMYVKLEERIHSYFDKFGQAWADALFESHVRMGKSAMMIDKRSVGQDLLTKFLRADLSRAKMSWINDVLGEKDFAAASAALMQVGTKQETRDWSKKVEMSLAKLSLMAAEADGEPLAKSDAQKAQCDNELLLLDLQEKTYKHIKPAIDAALDDETAIDLVMQDFGRDTTDNQPALQQLLKHGFERLIAHQVLEPGLLIDVLTLMNHERAVVEADNISGQQFFLALQALVVSEKLMDAVTWEGCLKLAWKRAFLMDEWAALNNTTGLADEQVQERLESTVLFETLREGYRTAGLWDKYPNLRQLAPQEVMDAGCRAAELESRFPSEDLRDPIIKDNIKDDDALQVYISHQRVGHWFVQVRELAKQRVQEEAEGTRQARAELAQQQQAQGEELHHPRRELNGIIEEEDSDAVMQASVGGFEGDDEQSEEVDGGEAMEE
ncbi:uncharacterized protein K452DRAFT_270331 [Aplosporella prunicola CBS 121167]|uniref:Nucleoporin Nup133/Nup155-like N-terminal domain-containing protein n=1 Tax=Aplosporella prunicola CBS 121167 TaxID=1176127 RepID=A0A6A6BGM4_9PEZI|nr:uncharacterized protein K452DRAFT_270331 [Aplosporella prunicola CBS 121167]KAF2142573.1 hypothetical protein K452DRAFT_270331 [Aplosporella prunicola CBS 121167]